MALKAVMKTHTRCIIICNVEMKMEYYSIKLTARVCMSWSHLQKNLFNGEVAISQYARSALVYAFAIRMLVVP